MEDGRWKMMGRGPMTENRLLAVQKANPSAKYTATFPDLKYFLPATGVAIPTLRSQHGTSYSYAASTCSSAPALAMKSLGT